MGKPISFEDRAKCRRLTDFFDDFGFVKSAGSSCIPDGYEESDYEKRVRGEIE